MLFTCARSIHINTDRKELKQVLHFGSVLNRDFPKLTSLSFSLRPSVLRHATYTIVDRYYMSNMTYDNERETLEQVYGGNRTYYDLCPLESFMFIFDFVARKINIFFRPEVHHSVEYIHKFISCFT
jgi:hypothetical protein